jgi:hypothetical protein
MTIFTYPNEKTSEGISEETKSSSLEYLKSKITDYYFGYTNIKKLKEEIKTGISKTKNYPQENLKYPMPEYDFYTSGYLDYLMFCWENDLGIEIAPCYIWNIILWKICGIVNENPEQFRHIFTKNSEKETIAYVANEFNPIQFLEFLKPKIPTDTDVWFPNFEFQPENYHSSISGLFAEMVQKYYGCLILGCGCPKIRLIGNKDEWQKIIDCLDKMPINHSYIAKAKSLVTEFSNNLENPEYWKKFFYGVRCGSGSQVEYKGFVIQLAEARDTVDKVPNTLGKYQFEYDLSHTNIPELREEHLGENGGVKVYYHSGIMGGVIDEHGIAIPKYNWNISLPDPNAGKLTEAEIERSKKLLDILTISEKFQSLNKGWDYEVKATPETIEMEERMIGYIPFIFQEFQQMFYTGNIQLRSNKYRAAVVDFFEKLIDYPEDKYFDDGHNYYPTGKKHIRNRYRQLKTE